MSTDLLDSQFLIELKDTDTDVVSVGHNRECDKIARRLCKKVTSSAGVSTIEVSTRRRQTRHGRASVENCTLKA